MGVLVRVLDQRDRFDAAADGDGHAVSDDLLGGDRDRHQPGAALPVDSHARHGDGHARAERCLPGHVVAGRAFLHGAAEDDVVDLLAGDPGPVEGSGEGVRGELRT